MCLENIYRRYVDFYADFAFKKLFETGQGKTCLSVSFVPCCRRKTILSAYL